MVDGSVDPSWSDRLQQQTTKCPMLLGIWPLVAIITQRLLKKANTAKIEVGDRIMVPSQRITPLAAKWDHYFIVTNV